jgi:uncharacterized delta-60 repeat protein
MRLRHQLLTIGLAITSGLPVSPSHAAPGALDPSFGTGGIVSLPLQGYADLIFKVLQQPDGKILVATFAIPGPLGSSTGNAQLVRLLANGAIDTSFGTNGIVTFTQGTLDVSPADMQLQPDGSILVAGSILMLGVENPPEHGFVARFTPPGVLDPSFGTGGVALITPLSSDDDGAPTVLLQQTDGKIVIGYSETFIGHFIGQEVLRRNDDGTPDTGFGTGGAVRLAANRGNSALALQTDGKIIAVSTQPTATRLLANGMLDNSTAPGTVAATTSFQALTDTPPLTVQPDSRYITAVEVYGQHETMQLQRFTLANRPDISFHSPDIDFVARSKRADRSADYAMTLQANGDVLVAGSYLTLIDGSGRTHGGGYQSFGLARAQANGKLDKTFGKAGSLITALPGHNARATAVTVQSDGNIVIAGTQAAFNESTSILAVARYLGN